MFIYPVAILLNILKKESAKLSKRLNLRFQSRGLAARQIPKQFEHFQNVKLSLIDERQSR